VIGNKVLWWALILGILKPDHKMVIDIDSKKQKPPTGLFNPLEVYTCPFLNHSISFPPDTYLRKRTTLKLMA